MLALCLLAAVAAVGCGRGSAVFGRPAPTPLPTASPTPWSPPAFANAAAPLDIPTYDGSGQAVHPDVVYFPNGWHSHRYWMAMTPYPYGTDSLENPSVLVSDDGQMWSTPEGLDNPIVSRPGCDHNSDPDMLYNPRSDELYLYYTQQSRADRCPGENANSVLLVTSADGVHWSAPRTAMRWDLGTNPLYLSPAVVYVDGLFQMWAAGENTVVHATSKDGINWSPVRTVDLAGTPWHLDVAYVDGQYVMLFVDSPGAGAHLRLATSGDGTKWTVYPDPLLSPSNGWDGERIYRATLLYDGASRLLKLWYSAKSAAGQWHIGYSEATH